MDKEEIIEELRLQNPWWRNDKVPLPEKTTEREIMVKIREDLKKGHITAIIGIRRSGKTTLYRILIKELLRTSNPERICYFSFDLAETFLRLKIGSLDFSTSGISIMGIALSVIFIS